jgi:hypothetical protein
MVPGGVTLSWNAREPYELMLGAGGIAIQSISTAHRCRFGYQSGREGLPNSGMPSALQRSGLTKVWRSGFHSGSPTISV